ncbi:MAG: HYR domain-containing protein, partial [Candidatus Thorarchaeota archaeon]
EVDNTQYFSITTTGLLTSNEKLPVGAHQVTVTVYDPFGNSNSFTFTVAVQSIAAGGVSIPLAITIIFEIMGGVFVILACVFVMAKRYGVTELPDIGDGLTGHFLRTRRIHLNFGGGDYK